MRTMLVCLVLVAACGDGKTDGFVLAPVCDEPKAVAFDGFVCDGYRGTEWAPAAIVPGHEPDAAGGAVGVDSVGRCASCSVNEVKPGGTDFPAYRPPAACRVGDSERPDVCMPDTKCPADFCAWLCKEDGAAYFCKKR